MVRKPSFPLQQIIRWLSETTNNVVETTCSDLKHQHDLGPLPAGFNGWMQYQSVKFGSQSVKFGRFVLKLGQRDRFFRINGHIDQLENIISKNGDTYVADRTFTHNRTFFDTPLD
jgi:hypothetical protein